MSDDLFANLGLQFVDITQINTGLKLLKPGPEPQIFSVILSTPTLQCTALPYWRHNFYSVIKKNIMCNHGACCEKAKQFKAWLDQLPENDPRKSTAKPTAQKRIMLPVVVYTGKSVSAYGGPVEVRYFDISEWHYSTWANARNAVNEEIAPFWQRDFLLTLDEQKKNNPAITHLETKAKWLTDPTLNAEVMKIISSPEFVKDYSQKVPKSYTDTEFLAMWNANIKNVVSGSTAAEQAINTAATNTIMQQQTPIAMQQTQTVLKPAYSLDNSVLNTPPIMVQAQPIQAESVQTVAQPIQAEQVQVQPIEPQIAPEPIQTQPVQAQPINMGLPVTQIETKPSVDVPYTPQNIINGSYSTGGVISTVTPESVVSMQPVTLPSVNPEPVQMQPVQSQPATPVQPEQSVAPTAQTPVTSQTEINLNQVQDLDKIISQLG